jgi:hypothetical protein
MHGIKYFFLNKNNQTIQGGQKKFPGGDKVPKTLPKSTIFQNPGGARAPPWIKVGPPLQAAGRFTMIIGHFVFLE